MERQHHRPLVVAALALACFSAAAPALAQDDATRARELFDHGVTSMNENDPATASGYFQQSFDLYPRASTACNMALSLERTQRACEAVDWYQRCASLDDSSQYRDHANQQIASLSSQCTRRSPFVGQATPVDGSAGTQMPATQDTGTARPVAPPGRVIGGPGGPRLFTYDEGGVDHGLLGGGITCLVLGVGALVGGALSAGEAGNQAAMLPPGGGTLVEGTPAANAFHNAETFSYAAIGLYVGSGVLGALGLILIAADLAQPGVFGTAAVDPSFRLALMPTVGGATADLRVRF